jgi:transportin-3
MLGGQEHELIMRTVELIEDNARQALELLIRYATSSRTSSLSISELAYANTSQLRQLETHNC